MNYREGQKVVIVANYANHGWPNGKIVTLARLNANRSRWSAHCDGSSYSVDLRDIAPCSVDIKSLKNQRKEFNEEIQEIDNKIKYMKENSLEELDDEEWRIVKLMESLDQKTDRRTQAKNIMKLLGRG